MVERTRHVDGVAAERCRSPTTGLTFGCRPSPAQPPKLDPLLGEHILHLCPGGFRPGEALLHVGQRLLEFGRVATGRGLRRLELLSGGNELSLEFGHADPRLAPRILELPFGFLNPAQQILDLALRLTGPPFLIGNGRSGTGDG